MYIYIYVCVCISTYIYTHTHTRTHHSVLRLCRRSLAILRGSGQPKITAVVGMGRRPRMRDPTRNTLPDL